MIPQPQPGSMTCAEGHALLEDWESRGRDKYRVYTLYVNEGALYTYIYIHIYTLGIQCISLVMIVYINLKFGKYNLHNIVLTYPVHAKEHR